MPIIEIKKKWPAFTLIELIMVVVVVTILALIAIPNYSKSKNRALQKEAISNLKLMVAAERIYRMEYSTYAGCSCGPGSCSCNSVLKLMLNPANWIYGADASGNITANSRSFTCQGSYSPATYDNEPAFVGAGLGCR